MPLVVVPSCEQESEYARLSVDADTADVVDAVVVGAGVVGLAIGRALAATGRDTLVLERNQRFGEETSSRNSCVVHSGIYYPAGSLKARLCVSGRDQMYQYAAERGVWHQRCGKLIVAQRDQLSSLEALRAKGVENGVAELHWLDERAARELEPEVSCAAALYSPATGIIDVHGLMTALLGDLEASSGMLVVNSSVQRVRPVGSGFEVKVRSDDDESTVIARQVVNAAGLDAVEVTRRIDGYPADRIPRAYLAKGNYFSCPGRPFRHLVYPMPNDAGLGIHATLDLDGSVRFGPDVEWVEAIDYSVDGRRAADFYASIRLYWPALPDDALQPAYAGIRPKIVGPGQKAADFVIAGPAEHGLPGLVNLLGIESPGLTAALAIADHVRGLLDRGVPGV
ncbi:MAG: NAD(P)/FAD-dependent oxidoreductase [Steroidobacteraceae bacterium]|nr:NAD(P)/FAD-dependent oxidoreductase [Steroidobacteraceae bacterium]